MESFFFLEPLSFSLFLLFDQLASLDELREPSTNEWFLRVDRHTHVRLTSSLANQPLLYVVHQDLALDACRHLHVFKDVIPLATSPVQVFAVTVRGLRLPTTARVTL